MPKVKTHKGATKRFKVTGSGKVRRYKAYKSHILTKKTSKRKRRLRQAGIVATTGDTKRGQTFSQYRIAEDVALCNRASERLRRRILGHIGAAASERIERPVHAASFLAEQPVEVGRGRLGRFARTLVDQFAIHRPNHRARLPRRDVDRRAIVPSPFTRLLGGHRR